MAKSSNFDSESATNTNCDTTTTTDDFEFCKCNSFGICLNSRFLNHYYSWKKNYCRCRRESRIAEKVGVISRTSIQQNLSRCFV